VTRAAVSLDNNFLKRRIVFKTPNLLFVRATIVEFFSRYFEGKLESALSPCK
jgi:hypothetical protein